MTRTKTKILVDANVLIAASIQANIKSIGIEVKHTHYDQSIHLFSKFRKYAAERIGITTKTVRGESFHALSKAVQKVITGNLPSDLEKRKKLFNAGTAIINLCDNKMRVLVQTLLIEKTVEDDVQENLHEVQKMSEHIKLRWDTRYSSRMLRSIEAKRRTQPIMNTKWKAQQKTTVYWAQRRQVERESLQPERFMRHYPNAQDARILAEAISIKNTIKKNSDSLKFFIASCDMGFFSPLRVQGGAKSDVVTCEIFNRFGIICDFPNEIMKIIK